MDKDYGFIYVDEDYVDLLDFSYITCELSQMDMISGLLKSSNKLNTGKEMLRHTAFILDCMNNL